MPNNVNSSTVVKPSTEGSAPVEEVFQRFQVRDPNRHADQGYRRRMEDLEFHWSLAHTAGLCLTAAVIVIGAMVTQMRKPLREATLASAPSAPPAMPAHQATVRHIPRRIVALAPPLVGPAAPPAVPEPELLTPVALPAPPENLHVDFLGPRTLEFKWTMLGDGTRYMLYRATSSSMENAEPVLTQPVPSAHALWIADDGAQSVWMAVKGIDANGQETPFSQPLLVQMPPME